MQATFCPPPLRQHLRLRAMTVEQQCRRGVQQVLHDRRDHGGMAFRNVIAVTKMRRRSCIARCSPYAFRTGLMLACGKPITAAPRVAVRSAVWTYVLARTSRGAPELGTNLPTRSKVKIMRSRVRYQASAIEARESGTTEVRALDLVPRFGHRLPSFVLSRNAALALGARVRRVSDLVSSCPPSTDETKWPRRQQPTKWPQHFWLRRPGTRGVEHLDGKTP